MKHLEAAHKNALFILISFIFSISYLHGEDFFFDSAGIKIHYVIEGKGEPVLLIHGFGQNTERMTGIIEALSDDFQVIAMDVRGHGKSDKPYDPDSYGMSMVEDPIRLLDHLKIRKTHVVGYSMGGRITYSLLGNHPERVRTAVIGGCGWVPPDDDSFSAIRKETAESLEQGRGVEPLILSLIPVGEPRPTPEQIELINKIFFSWGNDPKALAAVQRNLVPFPTKAQLLANKVPILSLIGELDPAKYYVDPLSDFMPNLKIVVIPKAHHANAFEAPEFIQHLKYFLQEYSAQPSGTR